MARTTISLKQVEARILASLLDDARDSKKSVDPIRKIYDDILAKVRAILKA